MRGEKEYSIETFVHVFDSCTQDWFSVASILEHLLVTIKQEHSAVNRAYLKSDNVGCYHNASLILSLKPIGERDGIYIKRYDFSDPQTGKDICDRRIAPMKGHIQRWVDEKHDVVTAVDMKTALESYGGVRGCRVAVAEVDVSQAAEMVEWRGISSLFNFEFLPTGARARKAYGIGKGQMFLYEELSACLQGPTKLRIIMPFTPLTASSKTGLMLTKKTAANRDDLFMCEAEGCVATFQTQSELHAHMDTGRHLLVTERESVYDMARKATPLRKDRPLQGWALKSQRKGQRATERVKNFLLEKFNKGVKTGNYIIKRILKVYFQTVCFTICFYNCK